MSFDFVQTTPRSASSLVPHAPAEQLALGAEAGGALRDARVIHVNSTAVGGGVAEVLKSLTPLMSDCGPETEWMVIRGTDDFFEITKRLHNLLQGADGELTQGELERYVAHNENGIGPVLQHNRFKSLHDLGGLRSVTAARHP